MKEGFALRTQARGFTLVELMVSMAISLFLLLGLASLMIANGRTSRELDKTSRQIENGRYAVQVISDDLNLAGYYGDFTPKGAAITLPDPCATAAANFGFDNSVSPVSVAAPVYGYVGGGTSPLACLDHYQPDTGVLVVRRVSSSAIAVGAMVAGETYIQPSGCANDPKAFVIDSSGASFTLLQKDCTSVASLRKYMVRIYYVSSCTVCAGSKADTVPTLKVAELSGGAIVVTPLAEGIQDLRLDYGVDLDNNGSADCYVANPGIDNAASCTGWASAPSWSATLQNWGNVATVRPHVLARNTEPTPDWTDTRSYDLGLNGSAGPFNDTYKRHAYSSVARIVNVGGMRE